MFSCVYSNLRICHGEQHKFNSKALFSLNFFDKSNWWSQIKQTLVGE